MVCDRREPGDVMGAAPPSKGLPRKARFGGCLHRGIVETVAGGLRPEGAGGRYGGSAPIKRFASQSEVWGMLPPINYIRLKPASQRALTVS